MAVERLGLKPRFEITHVTEEWMIKKIEELYDRKVTGMYQDWDDVAICFEDEEVPLGEILGDDIRAVHIHDSETGKAMVEVIGQL